MNHASARIVFELPLDRHGFAGMQRDRSRDINVRLDPQQQIAFLREFQEKAFVLAARTVAGSEHGKDRAGSKHFRIARAAGVECADVRIIGLFGLPRATAGEREEAECEA
jgi:hypothetical protein